MSSLKEIGTDKIWTHLSEDARKQLIGQIYVPYLSNIANILYEVSDEDFFDETIMEFMKEFPELVEHSNEHIMNPYELISKGPFKRITGIKVQQRDDRRHTRRLAIIKNDLPFEFNRNNRLIHFFVKRELPVFAGIKNVTRLNKEPL
jgi:hypothetical protein